jgi:hypothetical protein
MTLRRGWLDRLESAWAKVPIVWLAGVRQVGKTTLAKQLGNDVCFLNCDLPSTADLLGDPMRFFRDCGTKIVVFDEVHQLTDPSRILKIAADEFPHLRILATGSSTLSASAKFTDTLTGRKRQVHLVPVLFEELDDFGVSLNKRLAHGGLPKSLLSDQKEPAFFREWLDSYYARDIQRVFGLRDANKFIALCEYLLRQSGGLFEASRAASALGVARATIGHHLRALEVTHAVTLVRPFHGGNQAELVRQPKIYGFDTGFVSFARGWDPLRPSDYGHLWEHLVLESFQAKLPDSPMLYWRDKAGHEVDFVRASARDAIDAYECKWHPDAFETDGLKAFRKRYPNGRNVLLTPTVTPPHVKSVAGIDVEVRGLDSF